MSVQSDNWSINYVSIAKESFRITGLFEAELLVELMLRFWQHPFADDADFRNRLLENAASALQAAISGHKLIEDLKPDKMNLVAAVYYVESLDLFDDNEQDPDQLESRREWLEKVRRSLPSYL